MDKILFSARLQQAITQSGTTRAAIARAAEMPWSQVYKLLKGQRPQVQADTLSRLAVVLGVSMDWLAGLTDDPRPRRRLARKKGVDVREGNRTAALALLDAYSATPDDRPPGYWEGLIVDEEEET